MKAKKIILKFVVIPIVVLLLVLIVGFIIAGNTLIKKGIIRFTRDHSVLR